MAATGDDDRIVAALGTLEPVLLGDQPPALAQRHGFGSWDRRIWPVLRMASS